MVRIGKTVTFDGSRETISNALVDGITKLAIVGVNWSFVDNNTMNIYGEQADLTTLKTHANNKGFSFDITGDAPAEPVSTPETPLTQDEIDARAFMKTAFANMKASEKTRLLAILETEYNLINTTPIAFADVPKSDLKWLR